VYSQACYCIICLFADNVVCIQLADIMYLYLTCSVSCGGSLYLDLLNVNKLKFKFCTALWWVCTVGGRRKSRINFSLKYVVLRSNASDLYMESVWLGHWLSWLRFFMAVFLQSAQANAGVVPLGRSCLKCLGISYHMDCIINSFHGTYFDYEVVTVKCKHTNILKMHTVLL
jgi:hypothetical protein